jgi:hypothetical protein
MNYYVMNKLSIVKQTQILVHTDSNPDNEGFGLKTAE